jgi:Fe-S-cluster containining protein
MMPMPWRYVSSWNCIACGKCCKSYDVVLNFPEWVNIVRSYGVGTTEPGINKFHLKRKNDGSCVFLCKFFDRWFCSLQNRKPIACKLWPFKILDRSRFGSPNEALYNYGDQRLFVYVDPWCKGIQWGNPTQEFTRKTLAELVEIALGMRRKQYYSTSTMSYRPAFFGARVRKVI